MLKSESRPTLDGLVSLVTGGTSGIGLSIARRLAGAGSHVTICGRSQDRVDDSLNELRAAGLDVSGQTCDVRDRAQVRHMIDRVDKSAGGVDILVNNAGLARLKNLTELTDAEIDEMLDVNLRGLFTVTRAVLDTMIQKGRGQIVNIASLAGRNGFKGGTAYAATKHAVLGFSRSLMAEVRDQGVRVIAVCPGSVDTPFFEVAGVTLSNPDRVLQPEDVADTVLACLTLPDRALVSEVDIRPANP